jgi:FKBP12-rapamycin complex-associated protein
LRCSQSSFQSKPEEDATPETAVIAVNAVPTTPSATPGASDDYYQTVVFTTLLSVLKDQALSDHHYTVIEAIMSIFKTQGLKCVTFLPQVCFPFFHARRGFVTYR